VFGYCDGLMISLFGRLARVNDIIFTEFQK
jgi:hypothetical protein